MVTSLNYKNNVLLESCALTCPGRGKSCNEDTTLEMCEHGIFGIADGMGGPMGGKMASEEVVNSIRERCSKISLDNEIKVMATISEAIVRAKVKIQQFAKKNGLEGIGSTIAILRLNVSNNSAYIVHAGDSRVYRLRERKLVKLTRDHLRKAEKSGESESDTPGKEETILTRAIGLYEKINLETTTIELQPNDIFLLCSSGLYNQLNIQQISEIMREALSKGINYSGNELILKAKEFGPLDDVSLVLVKMTSEIGAKKVGNRKPFDSRLRVVLIVVGIFLIMILLFVFIQKKSNIREGQLPKIHESNNVGRIHSKNDKESAKPSLASKQSQEELPKIEDLVSEKTNESPDKITKDEASETTNIVSTDIETEQPPKIASVQSHAEPQTSELDPSQIFLATLNNSDLISALQGSLTLWNTLKADDKHKLKVLMLKEINNACRDAKKNNYKRGDEIRKIFDESLLLDDTTLQRVIHQRRKLFESDFSALLMSTIESAKESCDWREVREILTGNKKMNPELLNSQQIMYAREWSNLADISNKQRSPLVDYMQQMDGILNRIKSLSEINGSLESDLENLQVRPVESCKKILSFSDKVRETLLNVADRLLLNLSIVESKDLERVLRSVAFDKTTLVDHLTKLEHFKVSYDQLIIAQKSLNREDNWIPPQIELAEFENWSFELVTFSPIVLDYVQFTILVLEEAQKQAEQAKDPIFNNPSLIREYKRTLEEEQPILPSRIARSYSKRFREAIVSD